MLTLVKEVPSFCPGRTVLAIKQYQDLQLSGPTTRTPAQFEGPKHMSDRPNPALPRSDLDVLMATLDVDVIGLIECLVSPGWRLSFGSAVAPAIHYNLSGTGRMVVSGFSAFPLVPHTLVITPAKKPFHIEVDDPTAAKTVKVVDAQWDPRFGERVQRFVAGDVDPMLMLICGYFRASYGSSIDLFASLSTPIVERFEPADDLGPKLQAALAEISGRQVGMQAMTTAILKQVLVTLLRRSLNSTSVWLERFSILRDRQIALAFADMLARPSADHSVLSLAQKACLSRSAFMARFARAMGCSPMVALRRIRMKRAADMLAARTFSVEQIARAVGYRSYSSFLRAFRQVHGYVPADSEGIGPNSD
ncbi:helix-turn-helix transcriptional regulator [Bradyrhizobium japonicum]|uniref:helix-turn-helix domain-containing protein n=1 Tax=Bradyrhizobium japonicum TaxID=375 RepID=UPI001BA47F17|nr:AraC family transcriptional regulator [Bradyrhizobium japonicum]MBR0734810.1 helix-turn-helix transcriptional regulator [Bradyrhizobium japonicum]MBR0809803.1 helix-turn-helix transcriptional regulator [Bradyrhizobium japonicum]